MTDDARRYRHLASALALLRATREAWCTRPELAERLGLGDRSVRRLIDVLRANGVAIRQRQRRRPKLCPIMEFRSTL